MPLPRMDAAELSRMLGAWSDLAPTLADALADALRELIDSGLVPPGMSLPSQRDLAATLQVSRATVAGATDALVASGHVTTRHGSGARVRSGRVRAHHLGDGRMFSFTNAPRSLIDLSTGALPASRVAREELTTPSAHVADYVDTDGYFPAGLPILRQALADQLTRDGIPTKPQELLVTAGAQQATTLLFRSLLDPGDLVLVEDPTYRGALQVLRSLGVRLEEVPVRSGGGGGDGAGGSGAFAAELDLDLAERALARGPRLYYCQTSVHNPTGTSLTEAARARLGAAIEAAGVVTVEDCCSYDLTRSGRPARTLAGHVDPELLVLVGTLSKTFWGGIRIGWIRAAEPRIRAFLDARTADGLATSIPDQLAAVRIIARIGEARRERMGLLEERLAGTETVLRELFPTWRWGEVRGGTGLWVDTGTDAVALAETAKKAGVLLAPGPGFSAHNGQRSMLRLPLWHEEEMLRRALGVVREGVR